MKKRKTAKKKPFQFTAVTRNIHKHEDLSNPKYQPVDKASPLKCPDHPNQKMFYRVRLIRSCINPVGKPAKKAEPAIYQTFYVCPVCDDLLRIEPTTRMHHANK